MGLAEIVGLGLGLGVGLTVALGVAVAVAVAVGVAGGVGLVKITLIPSSGTGETTFLWPTTNQAKRTINKIMAKAPTKYPNLLFPCGSILGLIVILLLGKVNFWLRI